MNNIQDALKNFKARYANTIKNNAVVNGASKSDIQAMIKAVKVERTQAAETSDIKESLKNFKARHANTIAQYAAC